MEHSKSKPIYETEDFLLEVGKSLDTGCYEYHLVNRDTCVIEQTGTSLASAILSLYSNQEYLELVKKDPLSQARKVRYSVQVERQALEDAEKESDEGLDSAMNFMQ